MVDCEMIDCETNIDDEMVDYERQIINFIIFISHSQSNQIENLDDNCIILMELINFSNSSDGK